VSFGCVTSETLHLLRDGDPRSRSTSKKTVLFLIGGVLASTLLLAGWVTAPFTIGGAPDVISSISASPVSGHPGQYRIRLRAGRADGGCLSNIWEVRDPKLLDAITGRPLSLKRWFPLLQVSAARYHWDVTLTPTLRASPARATPISLTIEAAIYPPADRLRWLRWRLIGTDPGTPKGAPGNLLSGRVSLPPLPRP
jgi:hypothetical protein